MMRSDTAFARAVAPVRQGAAAKNEASATTAKAQTATNRSRRSAFGVGRSASLQAGCSIEAGRVSSSGRSRVAERHLHEAVDEPVTFLALRRSVVALHDYRLVSHVRRCRRRLLH